MPSPIQTLNHTREGRNAPVATSGRSSNVMRPALRPVVDPIGGNNGSSKRISIRLGRSGVRIPDEETTSRRTTTRHPQRTCDTRTVTCDHPRSPEECTNEPRTLTTKAEPAARHRGDNHPRIVPMFTLLRPLNEDHALTLNGMIYNFNNRIQDPSALEIECSLA